MLLHLPVHLGPRRQGSIDLVTLLQSHPPYTLSSYLPNTETVTVYKAVVPQNRTLVNCGDYVELCLPKEQVGRKYMFICT